ncbi:MAG: transposase, partial [Myxococcota bacterium]
ENASGDRVAQKSTVLVHAVWATKRRARLLLPTMDAWLAQGLSALARRELCEVLAVGNADDHVHVLFALHHTTPLSVAIQQLKGGSSHEWNALKSAPHRLQWQIGYWAESVSPRDVWSLERYIRNQRSHHARSRAPEAWQLESVVN